MIKKISVLLIAIVVFSTLTCVAYAYDTGKVTASVLNVRSGAGTDSSVIGQLYNGQSVEIKEYKSNGWLKISYNGGSAYVSAQYVTIRNNQSTSRSGGTRQQVNRNAITTDALNFRDNPTTDAKVITVIPSGTKLLIDTEIGNGWAMFEYNGKIGYSSLNYITYDLSSDSVSSDMGTQVVNYAKKFLGVPYVYGGNGPNGFDCSGFTKYVYSKFGVSLNRVAADQVNNGTYVEKSNLKPGDLILFANTSSGAIGHVGIYVGNDKFIHASTNSYEVRYDNLSGHYSSVYHSARRIFK